MEFIKKLKKRMEACNKSFGAPVHLETKTLLLRLTECVLPALVLSGVMVILALFWPAVTPAAVPWICFMIIFGTGTSCRRYMGENQRMALLFYSINGVLCAGSVFLAYFFGHTEFMAYVANGEKILAIYFFNAGLLLIAWALLGLGFKIARANITKDTVISTYVVCLIVVLLSAVPYMLGVNRVAENSFSYVGIVFLVMVANAALAGAMAAMDKLIGDKNYELHNTIGPAFLGFMNAFNYNLLICILGALAYVGMATFIVVVRVEEGKKK